MKPFPNNSLHVLDGGLATELERHGLVLDGPLWSARALREAPGEIVAVHRDYLRAGAQCLITASYQASALGFVKTGLSSDAAREEACWALRRAVELAREAVAAWGADEGGNRPVWIAASLGPYGAALANGAEFHGNYGVDAETLRAFHRERVAALAEAGADLLAFETVPSLEEVRAIAEVLSEFPEVRAWVSVTCRDEGHLAHGERMAACAALLDGVPGVLAVGINCTAPALIEPLLAQVQAGTSKPVIVYPNSGEGWDATRRCWVGESSVAGYAAMAERWFRAGAQAVGGCCRTGPEHVRAVARVAASYFGVGTGSANDE